MACKDLATSDYVVGQVWGSVKVDRFLLDQRRERLDMSRTKEAVKELSTRWPTASAKLIEDKANGPAVIQEFHQGPVQNISKILSCGQLLPECPSAPRPVQLPCLM